MSGYGESGTETEQSGDGRWRPLDGGREDPSTVMIGQGGLKGALWRQALNKIFQYFQYFSSFFFLEHMSQICDISRTRNV